MALKEPCAKYQYVNTPGGPKILPVIEHESRDEEAPSDYNAGGYLPVKINDTFKDGRYLVTRKLGWGHFSTVWLVKDKQENRHSALKVVKSASRYAETARDEIKLLSQVAAANPAHIGKQYIVSFLDSFTHSGPQDSHICIVFEPLGENLLALIERNKKKGVPPPVVKVIAKQVLLGLQYLHDECDLVHTDIKPENILISIPDIETHIHAELSASSSPPSRRVGIPQPTKSRSGVSFPQRRTSIRERHVQIFDSQPLSSPSSRCGSVSGSAGSMTLSRYLLNTSSASASLSDVLKPRPDSKQESGSIIGLKQPTTTISPSHSATSSASSSPPSIPNGVNSAVDTPATSIGSDNPLLSKLVSFSLSFTSRARKSPVTQDSSIPDDKQTTAGSSSLIPPHHPHDTTPGTAGPSLLSQTAPSHLDHSKHDSATPLASSSHTPTPGVNSFIPISIKIADLGNATPSKRHYTEDIQTRQYRAPEAIIGRRDWGTRADVWSVACVIFELLTAEYLFDPHGQGELFAKDDDHMAQIIELMGDFPLDAKMGGKYSRELFDHTGGLRYIKSLKVWPLFNVMTEKYLFSGTDSAAFCAFLEPMLVPDQRDRKEARDVVNHVWLDVKDSDWVGVNDW